MKESHSVLETMAFDVLAEPPVEALVWRLPEISDALIGATITGVYVLVGVVVESTAITMSPPAKL